MKTFLPTRISLLIASLALAVLPASAQVVLSGTNYFQDFNRLGLDGGLPTGWSVREGGVSSTSLGNLASFPSTGTNTWAATSGAFENDASTIDNNAATTSPAPNQLPSRMPPPTAAPPSGKPPPSVIRAPPDSHSIWKSMTPSASAVSNWMLTCCFSVPKHALRHGPSNMVLAHPWGAASFPFGWQLPCSSLRSPTASFWRNNAQITHCVLECPSINNQPCPIWIRIVTGIAP